MSPFGPGGAQMLKLATKVVEQKFDLQSGLREHDGLRSAPNQLGHE